MIKRRRRFRQTTSLEDRLAVAALDLREAAKKLPPGLERERLLRRARQNETASHVTEWLTSRGPAHANLICRDASGMLARDSSASCGVGLR
jgi:hypothetical protein